MKKLLIVIVVAIAIAVAACEPPGWLAGHDNGEAYEEYTEQMNRLEEKGLVPDIYGYGW